MRGLGIEHFYVLGDGFEGFPVDAIERCGERGERVGQKFYCLCRELLFHFGEIRFLQGFKGGQEGNESIFEE